MADSEILKESFITTASDGYEIACHSWRPLQNDSTSRVIVLHGIQSHAGWYEQLGHILASQGIDVLMPDRRGSGANLKDRGHASKSGRLITDLTEINQSWNERSGHTRPPVLTGISWGGKLAAMAAAKSPDQYSGLALVAPGLFAKVRPPLKTQLKIAISALLSPKKAFEIPLSDPALFTANLERQQFIMTDPATLHTATARFFIASRAMDLRLNRIRKKLGLPIYLQMAELDRIVNNEKIERFINQTSSQNKTSVKYAEAHHTLEFEQGPVAERYALDLASWIKGLS